MYKIAQMQLTERDIRPTIQRLAVMEYLLMNKTHPTVDEIFSALSSRIPGLSRATVYNTVAILASRGVILSLDLDGSRTHYDGDTSPHAHFLCTRCGAIHDIFPEADGWHRMLAAVPPPEGASVTDTQLSYKGLCTKCNKQHID